MSALTDMYESFPKSFRSFNFCSYLPYLSPYIRTYEYILQYIIGATVAFKTFFSPEIRIYFYRYSTLLILKFKLGIE